jgi:transglutaminase/protease-like cytokinesis protein 3
MMDHPESNQILQGYLINNYKVSRKKFEIDLIRAEVYNGESSQLKEEQEKLAEVQVEAEAFVQSIKDEPTEQQYKLIHDYLISGEYDYSMGNESHTLWGAIVEKYAVCDGLAYSFKYMCDILDIPAYVVIGETAGQTDGVGHAWNVVPVDDQWLMIDTTYDLYLKEKSGQNEYEYFLKKELYSESRSPYRDYRAPGYLY